METRNHAEQFRADFGVLLAKCFPELAVHSQRFQGVPFLGRMRAGAEILLARFGPSAITMVADHPSDIVRGWGAFAVGSLEEPLPRLLLRARTFALDPHFAVREWAWLGVRPQVAAQIDEALEFLTPWAASSEAFLRRFAVEVTRPRSVWGVHCDRLRVEPWRGIGLIEAAARATRHRYVEDAVANWLNDARKTQPEWVHAVCQRWRSDFAVSDRLVRRALRLTRDAPREI